MVRRVEDGALRLLLFGEAFYGIDAGRRDQLLRFATLDPPPAGPDPDATCRARR